MTPLEKKRQEFDAMHSPFGRQRVNIINLEDSILVTEHWWSSIPEDIDKAYGYLMANDAYWEYPTHNEFSVLPTWHRLGNA